MIQENQDNIQSDLYRMTRLVRRYYVFINEIVPTLTFEEWCGLINAFNGGIVTDSDFVITGRNLPAFIKDAELEYSSRIIGYDSDVLYRKISRLPFASRSAILEVVDRFWSISSNGAIRRETLIECGARISEN